MKLKFGQYYAADVDALVEVMNLNLGRDFEARFGQYFEFEFEFSRDADVCLRF